MATSTILFPQAPENLVRDQAGNVYKMYCGSRVITPGNAETSVRVFTTGEQIAEFGRAFDANKDQFFCANADFSANPSEVVPVIESTAIWARECSNTIIPGPNIRINYTVLIRQ